MKQARRNFLKSAGLLGLSTLVNPLMASSQIQTDPLSKIKPPALKSGDTIAITSPAGAVWDEKQVGTFAGILKGFGFKVVYGQTLKLKHGYFAGTDEDRAKELNALFSDKNIQGIFCMKGGWGCARILDKLDYKAIAENPKVIMGFSDITALLLAIYAKTGLITFHGPVGNSSWNDFTKEAFTATTMKTSPYQYAPLPEKEETILCITKGVAEGELVGGNLSVLAGMLGSAYLPNWKDKILFLEDAKEEPYRIDRMLTQMHLNGILSQLNGIIFGKCNKCLAEEPQKSFTLQEVLIQHLQPLNIPVFYGAMFGHIENKITLPLGIRASFNAETGDISVLENSVQ